LERARAIKSGTMNRLRKIRKGQREARGERLKPRVSNYITYTLHSVVDIAETVPLVSAKKILAICGAAVGVARGLGYPELKPTLSDALLHAGWISCDRHRPKRWD